MNKNDGGSAYPHPDIVSGGELVSHACPGISLRDHFAAKAMQGVHAADASCSITAQNAAIFAYKVADAMLAEREKQS